MTLCSLKKDDAFVLYRGHLLDKALALIAIAATINLIFTVSLARQIGWQPYAVIQSIAVLSFILIWLTRRIFSYSFKAFVLITVAYTITFATLTNIGPIADSKSGVIVLLFIATVFLSRFYIILMFIAIILGFTVIGYLAVYSFLTFRMINYEVQAHELETWLNTATVLIAGGSVVAWIAHSMINELIASRQAADAANNAKSQFIANISHELRTPLNTILGFTNVLLEQQQGLTINQREHLAIIAHSSNSLYRLIEDVLDLARVESGRFKLQVQSTFLPSLIQEIIDTVEPMCKRKGLIFRFEIPESIHLQLFLDPERVRQIVLNLLHNAIKFTEQGEISLIITCKVIDQAHINLTINVADTGPGIALADRERIFLPFEQLHSDNNNSNHGLGLGLTVSRQIALLMDGQLTLEDTVGSGSCFRLTLPLMIAPHAQVAKDQFNIAESLKFKLARNDLPLNTDLQLLHELAELGMISDIQDWLRANGYAYPQFTHQLDELARTCDLPVLITFLDDCSLIIKQKSTYAYGSDE